MISAAQLESLADAADQFGAGTLELTARGNLQVRGITDTAAVADALAAAGLLPSATHERVRNILASPLSGRRGGLADIRPWVTELDHALQADPVLAGLPGRFLFSIDDGSADVSGLAADVGVHVVDDGVALLMNGRDTGIRLAADEAVTAMITVAARFAESRGTAWRIKELDDPGALVAGFTPVRAPVPIPAPPGPPVGWIEQPGGLVRIGRDGEGFGFDNEGPRHKAWLEPFELADRLVTNGEWLAFMADGGYRRPELWLSEGWARVCAEGWDAPLYWRADGEGGWSALQNLDRQRQICQCKKALKRAPKP